jgi:NCS1 family nucleobase:cation symporter-1
LADVDLHLFLLQQHVHFECVHSTLQAFNADEIVTNAPDFASRAKTPGAAVWPQIIALPMGFIITSFLGIGIASASAPQFGEQIWDVVHIMDRMLDVDPSPKTRAGLAFVSLFSLSFLLFSAS